jgi:hypothetical protein
LHTVAPQVENVRDSRAVGIGEPNAPLVKLIV